MSGEEYVPGLHARGQCSVVFYAIGYKRVVVSVPVVVDVEGGVDRGLFWRWLVR